MEIFSLFFFFKYIKQNNTNAGENDAENMALQEQLINQRSTSVILTTMNTECNLILFVFPVFFFCFILVLSESSSRCF